MFRTAPGANDQYKTWSKHLYASTMDVSITDLRPHLGQWIDRARLGEEVVVTDSGLPVLRLVGIGSSGHLERLEAEGIIGRPGRVDRPAVADRPRVVNPGRPLSDVVSQLRAE